MVFQQKSENLLSFSGKRIPKRTKNDVFALNKVKNGPKRPYNSPKGLKMHEKGKKIEFLDLKNLL